MPKGDHIFADVIAPSIGTLLAIVMWFAPALSIRTARQQRTMGSLNLLPYIMMIYCSFGNVLYGSMLSDAFIMWSNIVGMVLGYFCSHSVTAILNHSIIELEKKVEVIENYNNNEMKTELDEMKSQYFKFEVALYLAPLLWGFISQLVWVSLTDKREFAQDFVAWLVIAVTVIYFGAPLSQISAVISQKDSSSIYPPMVITSALNCAMWCVYGFFSINNAFIWGTNLAGLILQVINMLLCLVYKNTHWKEIPFCCRERSMSLSDSLER